MADTRIRFSYDQPYQLELPSGPTHEYMCTRSVHHLPSDLGSASTDQLHVGLARGLSGLYAGSR